MVKHQLSIIEDGVLNIIPRGQDNRKKASELAKLVGLDPRSFYAVINKLVIDYHIPIVATRKNGGIYIPRNHQELVEGLQALKNQAKDMNKRIAIVENADVEGWEKNIKRTVA